MPGKKTMIAEANNSWDSLECVGSCMVKIIPCPIETKINPADEICHLSVCNLAAYNDAPAIKSNELHCQENNCQNEPVEKLCPIAPHKKFPAKQIAIRIGKCFSSRLILM